jgi:hypothetical protein
LLGDRALAAIRRSRTSVENDSAVCATGNEGN